MAATALIDYPIHLVLQPVSTSIATARSGNMLVLDGTSEFAVDGLHQSDCRRLATDLRQSANHQCRNQPIAITSTSNTASIAMSAIDELFTKLRREKRKALMPFVTAGDPDLEFTAAVLKEVVGRGCHLCEVGIPYSDPIADGPVIQASLHAGARAQDQAGRHPRDARRRRAEGRRAAGDDGQLRDRLSPRIARSMSTTCSKRGLAGLIVPDLPVEESAAAGRRSAASAMSA